MPCCAPNVTTNSNEPCRLDRFQVVILDDLGYVQQSREEMEVLFTFLAERYERRSVVITLVWCFRKGTRSSRTSSPPLRPLTGSYTTA